MSPLYNQPLDLTAFVTHIPLNLVAEKRFVCTKSTRGRLLKRARTQRIIVCSTPAPADEPAEPAEPVEPTADWREFRAALIAGSAEKLENVKNNAYRKGHWAHSLSVPETGCFLASHPAYLRRSAPYLTQAVVFLTSYSSQNGAEGLVLNRPFRGTAAELESSGLFGRSTDFGTTAFADQPVYIGGPDSIESGVLSVVHGDDALYNKETMSEPLQGVYVGSVKDVPAGVADVSKIRLFAGCLKWNAGTLEKEVEEGSWYCISASNLFALEHCIQLAKPLWVEIMQGQGDPFAKIAGLVYKEDSDEETSD